MCDTSAGGDIRLELRLDRTRYRAVFADSQSILQETASVTFHLETEAPTRCSGPPNRQDLSCHPVRACPPLVSGLFERVRLYDISPQLAVMQRQEAALNRDVLVP